MNMSMCEVLLLALLLKETGKKYNKIKYNKSLFYVVTLCNACCTS